MAATNATTVGGTPSGADRGGSEGTGPGAYLRGVRDELKKAVWPTRAELIRLTQVVLILITVVAAFCGALDAGLGLITDKIFNRG